MKAIIFDLDGVITDTAEFHYLAWANLARTLGAPFTREFNEGLRGLGRLESLDLILAASNINLTAEEKLIACNKKNDDYQNMIKDLSEKDILPGIAELLLILEKNEIKKAIASASKNSRFVLNQLGLENRFDAIADGLNVTKSKPDPAVFIAAAEMLGVDAYDCIGIEDAAAGIQAINAAGMYSVGIGDPQTLYEAKTIIASTKQLTFDFLCGLSVHEATNF